MAHPSATDSLPAPTPSTPPADAADGTGRPPRGANRGRSRRPGWRPGLTVLSALLGLCCAGTLLGGAVLFQAVQGIGSPARDAADAFLADLSAGRVDEAYDRLCARTRREFTPQEFTAAVADQPITGYAIDDVRTATFGSRGAAVVATRLTLAGGRVVEHTVPVTEDRDHWQVCGDPY